MNLRDFPDKHLRLYNIEAVHPDQFISGIIKRDLIVALSAIKKSRLTLNNPSRNSEEYIKLIEKNHYL